MKTKFLILAAIALLIAMPLSIHAQKKIFEPTKTNASNYAIHISKKSSYSPEIRSFSGKITKWTYNENYVYDGFYFNATDGKTYYVKIPTHFGKKIRNAGNNISIDGYVNNSKRNNRIIFTNIRNTKEDTIAKRDEIFIKGKSITIRDNSKNIDKTLESATNGSGKVAQVLLNNEGVLEGYLLNNNSLLKIPKHVAGQLSQLIQFQTDLEYIGAERKLKEGEVAAKDYKIIYCNIITIINGTQYIVR